MTQMVSTGTSSLLVETPSLDHGVVRGGRTSRPSAGTSCVAAS